jgi:hypothetical protein
MRTGARPLCELISVGPAILRDFALLRVRSVAQLARQDPQRLYEKLCRIAPQHQDICCLDVVRAAVAQARNPRLPTEQCQWWYWSRRRKAVNSLQLTSIAKEKANAEALCAPRKAEHSEWLPLRGRTKR